MTVGRPTGYDLGRRLDLFPNLVRVRLEPEGQQAWVEPSMCWWIRSSQACALPQRSLGETLILYEPRLWKPPRSARLENACRSFLRRVRACSLQPRRDRSRFASNVRNLVDPVSVTTG